MKRKINGRIIILALLAVLSTMLFVTIIIINKVKRYFVVPAEDMQAFIFELIPVLGVLTIILIVLSIVLAYLLTLRLVHPIEILAENLENNDAKLRQEFTANVTHELKTPLTSISGYAELIENGMASEADVTRFAQGIHANANRLLVLINDIIRLSELDTSEEEAPMELLNLYQMAATCVEMLEPNAEKHGVSIQLTGEETYVCGNRMMVEELLYNLCDNAIRYNNKNGSVIVDVKPQKTGASLTVSDTGIGIPKEHQERIFERFYRVDKSRSKSTGGTGLGLAIVKHIIAKHYAKLEVESEPGKGTVMRIVFPK